MQSKEHWAIKHESDPAIINLVYDVQMDAVFAFKKLIEEELKENSRSGVMPIEQKRIAEIICARLLGKLEVVRVGI